MNQQAIEAGATALLKHGVNTVDFRGASGDWGACGYVIKEEFREHSRVILEAARPHLETEIRAKIATSIRDNPRVYDAPFTSNPADWIDAFDRGIDYAVQIAEGTS